MQGCTPPRSLLPAPRHLPAHGDLMKGNGLNGDREWRGLNTHHWGLYIFFPFLKGSGMQQLYRTHPSPLSLIKIEFISFSFNTNMRKENHLKM